MHTSDQSNRDFLALARVRLLVSASGSVGLESETVPSNSLTNLNLDRKNFQTKNQPKVKKNS